MKIVRRTHAVRFVGSVLLVAMGTSGFLAACRSSVDVPAKPAHVRTSPAAASTRAREALDPRAISEVIGAEPRLANDGVVRVQWSRDDVPVTVDGMKLPAAAGLTSWAAFASVDDGTVVMGDTVLFEDEVTAAMDAALAGNLEVTALHNHFLFDEPRVFFLHIGGRGDARELSRAVKAVWDAARAVRRAHPAPRPPDETPRSGRLDRAAIGHVVGHEPTESDGVVKVTLAREAAMQGHRFGGSMGLTTWAAFSGSDELAAMDGDFAMTSDEVQPVLRALRAAGIHVVALHNHMVGEQPTYYFVHFWAKGRAADLARGFRAAIDAQRGSPPAPALTTWTFDSNGPDEAPVGFSFGRTGGGTAGRWVVRADKNAPSGGQVLAQVDADATDDRFPVAVADGPSLKDLRLSVMCKPISGQVDQACGLVFRFGDENNYYLARANALEDNVRIYYVKDGKRRQFASWSGKVTSAAWHELRVDALGDRFEVYWDGQKVLDARDETFPGPGKVGL